MALTSTVDEVIERNTNGLLGKHNEWPRFRLGDVADIQNGAPYDSKLFNTRGEGMPLLRIRDVGANRTQAWYDGPFEERELVAAGDLLIGMDGEFRCARWQGPRALLNQRVCRVNFRNDLVNTEFVRLALPGYLNAVNEATPSITVKHLSSRTVADLMLPLPPRDDQDRIVERVTTLLQELDAAVDDLEGGSALARAARRAVYALADDKAHPRQPLGELLARIESGKSLRCESRPADVTEWGVIKVSAMTWGSFDELEQKALPPNVTPDMGNEVRAGDLLLSRANTTQLIGASVLVPESVRSRLLLSDKSLRLIPRSGVDRRWLLAALNAPDVREQISAMATGTSDSMRNISQPKLRSVVLHVPPQPEQVAVAQAVDTALAEIEALEQELATALRDARDLETATLRNAFEGELVKPGLDAARRANALLERIRESAPTVGKPRGGKKRHEVGAVS